MALQSWVELRSERLQMRRAAATLLHKGLSMGMDSWVSYVADVQEAARVLAVVRRAVGTLAHAGVARAYRAWQHRVLEMSARLSAVDQAR